MNRSDAKAINACFASFNDDELSQAACGLQRLIARNNLSRELRSNIKNIIDAGFTLCESLPAIDHGLLNEWLGQRWYLLHQHQLARMQQWSSIVASRLSRTDADFALWPRWLEQAIRVLAREQQTVLLVPGTATAKMVEPLACQASLARLTVRLPTSNRKPTDTIGHWLLHTLADIAQEPSVAYATLFVCGHDEPCSPWLAESPLQDRLAVALSHRVVSLSLRAGGNIAKLLGQRLQDDRFPAGTVSLRIPSKDNRADHNWLDRHAVGWYLPSRTDLTDAQPSPVSRATHCQTTFASTPALTSWTADARLLMSPDQYLVHCVRGSHDDAFREGDCTAVIEAIVKGNLSSTTPYDTLLKIVSQRRLRASGKLLRTNVSAVSFTSVALTNLLQRRRYQSHLGRWDWEPYGLMIRRDALERLGARPVVYGDEEQFEQLDVQERHFYQPAQRRSARAPHEHWQAEQEWRLLDDVRLNQLAPGCIVLFVQFQSQAQSLAAHSPWPIIWLQADQTQPLPIAAARPRRRSARISKN